MRTVLLGDVVAAARALLAVPEAAQGPLLARMLDQAHVAHHVHKRLGRPHPEWGNGSLMARAAALPQAREPCASDPAYLAALRVVIEGLLRRSLG
ncbi:hypothetical protein RNZ50_15030 [Paracoccaceae bacterium Fryx2]|nr:hypothetical protein [Paracoccaceae bacterium Fryx2]